MLNGFAIDHCPAPLTAATLCTLQDIAPLQDIVPLRGNVGGGGWRQVPPLRHPLLALACSHPGLHLGKAGGKSGICTRGDSVALVRCQLWGTAEVQS